MEFTNTQKPSVAYFCAEFGLDDNLPIYSGGLGILAGDVIREAEDQNYPLVGIGLLYKEGYFKQVLSPNGTQSETPAFLDTSIIPVKKILSETGQPFELKIYIEDRTIIVHAWEYLHGKTKVILLDTDVPENSPLDQRLTLSLYPSDSDWRIQQEIILGIGGVRALAHLKLTPQIYHLNEGHSAFAVLEIAHQHMKKHASQFKEAFAFARKHVIFTNHTLIPSGNDIFSKHLVEKLLKGYADHLGLDISEVLAMGSLPLDPDTFSMTHLALNESVVSSAVSKSHAQFAKVAWPTNPLIPITNGVHRGFWQNEEIGRLAEQASRGEEIALSDLWETHNQLKHSLLKTVREITGRTLSSEVLTLTWARRVTSYKQPLLMFSNLEKLVNIVKNPERPVQILIAGKAHPNDLVAKQMIQEISEVIVKHQLQDHIVFIPNYSISLAKQLVAGSDVWVNTPKKGQEACGTSGIKSAMNGGLQFAISDGWTDEIPLHELGFAINPILSENHFYSLLEEVVTPLYYQNRTENMPENWALKMTETIAHVSTHFNSSRMFKQYQELLYNKITNSD